MKFPYIVNHDGSYYPAGSDVPVGETVPEVAEAVGGTVPEVAEAAKRGRPPKSK